MPSGAEPPEGQATLVRVTLAGTTRRADLLVPGAWPVADLTPELARSVGVLDVRTAGVGYRLVTLSGRELSDSIGLVAQGVHDGAILTVVPRDASRGPLVHDDTAEALTEALPSVSAPWGHADSCRASLVAAGALLAVGAVALVLVRSALSASVATALACGLTGTGVVLSRRAGAAGIPVTLALAGVTYAATAGLLWSGVLGHADEPMSAAGACGLAAASASMLGLVRGRFLLLPGVVGGAALLGAGGLSMLGLTTPVVLAGLTAVIVASGAMVPRVAASPVLGRAPLHGEDRGRGHGSVAVAAADLTADAITAEELMVGLSAASGLVLLATGPLLATLRPPAGAGLALVCCAVEMLRARRYRSRAVVAVHLAVGLAGMVALVAVVLWLHPGWRGATALGVVAAGLVALPVGRAARPLTDRWPRLLGVLEAVLLVALAPALLLAAGVDTMVEGWPPW